MSPESRPGPPPTDELACAEAALQVLQQVLHTIGRQDKAKQTPCPGYDVKKLTEHLLNSIVVLGGMVGAEFSLRADIDSVERLVSGAARSALDAWHRHGLEGDVSLGPGSMSAKVAVSVFSVEFLVHAWDYAVAVGSELKAADSLAEYVLELARKLIKPEERRVAGFNDAVDVPEDSGALERLIAFTGRNPAR
ncbi:TIGR03086 family metal-binding protein [Mycobacterium canetti]|uniref:TIGR03086 family metal-binding protein n=1 Tax=Mycobacterium canetti TaxID=78331 RepID=UPI0003453127|nr:TIGR03086 family metal-binding protein [Mycobacterium canetti]MBC9077669.1 TIGR03086 family protein [Mycobacterium canetti]